MARKAANLLVLGEGPLARAFGIILRAEVVRRNSDDTGWDWSKSPVSDKMKLLMVAAPDDGADRIVRRNAEAWRCPKVSRIGSLIVVPGQELCDSLLQRDVFGRKGETDARFCDYDDVVKLVSAHLSLKDIVLNLGEVGFLPVDTWHRDARNASCIPRLLETIKRRDEAGLTGIQREALDIHWDAICFPTPTFSNPHQHAYAIELWLRTVTLGVTQDWVRGLELIAPLASR
jgi:hypothetical protein